MRKSGWTGCVCCLFNLLGRSHDRSSIPHKTGVPYKPAEHCVRNPRHGRKNRGRFNAKVADPNRFRQPDALRHSDTVWRALPKLMHDASILPLTESGFTNGWGAEYFLCKNAMTQPSSPSGISGESPESI